MGPDRWRTGGRLSGHLDCIREQALLYGLFPLDRFRHFGMCGVWGKNEDWTHSLKVAGTVLLPSPFAFLFLGDCCFLSLPVFFISPSLLSLQNWKNRAQRFDLWFPPFISSLLLLSQGAEASIVGDNLERRGRRTLLLLSHREHSGKLLNSQR
ncbi:hypothetical protein Dimus_027838 [Dionaea muscipula]